MITILLGGDSISKEAFITQALAAQKLELRRFRSGDQLPNLTSLSEPTLFGPASSYAFDRCWKDLDIEQLIEVAANSPTQIFILEDSIDQRKTINKAVLKDKRITVKQFEAPTRDGTGQWLAAHAAGLDLKLDPKAINALVETLVPDEFSKLDVNAAHNELLKLQAYAGKDPVTPEMIELLVLPNQSIDIFKLLNAVATRNKAEAHLLLNKFFDINVEDEKAKAIQVSALLADQLRNILLVQDANARRVPDNVVLEKTGWKSGRLFVMKKLSGNFTPTSVKQAMTRLESLDIELKSSTMPPHVILDLIIAQM